MVSVLRPPARGRTARTLAPSLKVTVPVGVPPAPLTVAVKVTAWPPFAGLAEEVTAVFVTVVPGSLTVCVSAAEVEVAKFESPLYIAVMLWGPAVSDEVTRLARPPERGRTESVASPSRKLTVPVGAFAVPATVATRVTAWPVVDGLMEELRVVVEAAVPAVVTVWVTTGELEPA